MDISLHGKKALVTGGTRGIGRGIVLALAAAGADVMACSRTGGEQVEDLARELKETGGQHHLVRADVSRPADIEALVADARARFAGLDILVNNAGGISHVPFAELSLAEWRRIVDTNLTSAFYLTQRALPLLGPGASIVNVGSKVALVGIPQRSHYTASKAGLIGLTRTLAKELGPQGIRVNVVAPGVTATEAELAPQVVERYSAMTALRKLGTVEQIASVVLFLASDQAGYVTGEVINVDGGI